MKIDIDTLRELYLNALQGKLNPKELEIATNTLDSVVHELTEGRNSIIEELANDGKYSHGVFGCFGGGYGHHVKETRGPCTRIKEYAGGESEYGDLFKGEIGGPEFKARISGRKVEDGFTLRLIFNDRQGDQRDNSHTDYTLFTPQSETERIVPLVKNDPRILMEVFQKVFPDYDRSNGKLTIDSHNVGKINYQS